MQPDTEAALRNISATFSGDDGGVGFVALRGLIEEMDRQATGGDAAARQVVDVMLRFSRLIDTAKRALTTHTRG